MWFCMYEQSEKQCRCYSAIKASLLSVWHLPHLQITSITERNTDPTSTYYLQNKPVSVKSWLCQLLFFRFLSLHLLSLYVRFSPYTLALWLYYSFSLPFFVSLLVSIFLFPCLLGFFIYHFSLSILCLLIPFPTSYASLLVSVPF